MSADEENKILTALNNLHVEMEKRFTALETLQQEQRPRCNAHATATRERMKQPWRFLVMAVFVIFVLVYTPTSNLVGAVKKSWLDLVDLLWHT